MRPRAPRLCKQPSASSPGVIRIDSNRAPAIQARVEMLDYSLEKRDAANRKEILMSRFSTVIGRVSHVGQYSYDEHVHQYSLIEIETPSGRVDLKNITAANELSRAVSPGKPVAMTVLEAHSGSEQKALMVGIYDQSTRRLHVNEEIFTLRHNAKTQALLYTLLGIVVVPVGLALFLVPGLLYIRAIWKAWSSIEQFPSTEEMRSAVSALEISGQA